MELHEGRHVRRSQDLSGAAKHLELGAFDIDLDDVRGQAAIGAKLIERRRLDGNRRRAAALV